MNLEISNQLFIIGGASSGFGKAITLALVKGGANIMAVARGEEKLKELEIYVDQDINDISYFMRWLK